MTRRETRTVVVGWLPIGGGNPIVVQSMTNTDTRDVAATVDQIRALQRAAQGTIEDVPTENRSELGL